MDEMLETLRTATPAPGQDRVRCPGLSEHEEMETRRASGIPLHKEVILWFAEVTSEPGIAPLAGLEARTP
jgi:LDH2 family malate/lactate/ureidoglycolate dehydrogenase